MVRTSKSTPATPAEAHPSDDFQLMAQHAGGYCGQALKEAREKQGLSIENIAGRLRLSVRQINAIETDSIAQLPQASTVRGFIRNYAKELKIDAVPLIEAFNKISPDKSPQALTLEPSTNMAISSSEPSKFPVLMWLGFALISSLGIWWAMQYFGTKMPATSPEVTEPATVSEVAAPNVLPVAEPAPIDLNTPPPTEPVIAIPADSTIVTPNSSRPSTVLPVATPEKPLVAPSAEAAAPNSPVMPASNATNNTRLDKKLGEAAASSAPNQASTSLTPLPAELVVGPVKTISTGKANLSISTTEETWVNIVDANGKEMYSKLLSAGSSEDIAISKPLSITIGNATGATLVVDGAPMTLNTRSGSKVARVKLR
jgi:cytoskeleton protein RodZ